MKRAGGLNDRRPATEAFWLATNDRVGANWGGMAFPSFVRDNPFFSQLTDEQVGTLEAIAQEQAFEGGDMLVRQFDRQSSLMIVLSGKVCIKTFSGETVAELTPGGVVGEVSLVDDAPRSANVVGVGPGRVAVLPADALRNLLDSNPLLRSQIMENIARILAGRLRAANIQLDAASGRI